MCVNVCDVCELNVKVMIVSYCMPCIAFHVTFSTFSIVPRFHCLYRLSWLKVRLPWQHTGLPGSTPCEFSFCELFFPSMRLHGATCRNRSLRGSRATPRHGNQHLGKEKRCVCCEVVVQL